MRRGDVVTAAAAGDSCKPRPAVVVQTDALPDGHASVIICQMTTSLAEGAAFRVLVEPSADNGLKERSQIMTDKPVTVRRERIGERMGRLNRAETRALNVALAFALGLAD